MNSNWSYSPKTAKLGCDLCELDLWSLTLTFCMDITLVRGDNFMMIRWWEHSQRGVTDRQTDRQTDRKYHSQGCFVAAKNAKAGACNFSKHSSASFHNMTCQMSQQRYLVADYITTAKQSKAEPVYGICNDDVKTLIRCDIAVMRNKCTVHCVCWYMKRRHTATIRCHSQLPA